MIFSMTGYAALEQPIENATLLLELRAVNSRYLDLHFKVDENLRNLEPVIRELVSAQLSRGKIECKLNLIQRTQAHQATQLDEMVMQKLVDMQTKVRIHFPQSRELSVADILRWPGVVLSDATSYSTLVDDVKKLVLEGLQALNDSRAREGEKLKAIVLERLTQIEVLVEKVSKKSKEEFSGRNSQSITVVFPKENYKIGDFVNVKITSCTSGTLKGEAVGLSEMN